MSVRPVSSLAKYINGFPFKPEAFTDEGLPVVRIRQLKDPTAPLDYFSGPVPVSNQIDSGDLVFSWSGSLAVEKWTRGPALLNQHLFKVLPAEGVDRDWLKYALEAAIPRFSSFMHGTGMTHLTADVMRSVRVHTPFLAEQRRIADFLDDQVARIDSIVAAREKQIALLREALISDWDHELDSDGARVGWLPLRRWVRSIEQGWSPECENRRADQGESAILKLSAVKAGRFDANENKALPLGIKPEARYRIKPKDLLITRANTPSLVGDSAVVDQVESLLYLPDLIYRVSLRSEYPEYFSSAIRGGRNRANIRVLARGTSQTMVKLRGDDVLDLQVPGISEAERRRKSMEIEQRSQNADHGVAILQRVVEKLTELKRSLITAGVTGEFDVSSTDGSRVPV